MGKNIYNFNDFVNESSENHIEQDQSIRNINAEELTEAIVDLYQSKISGGRAKPILIYGAQDIRKTEITEQTAASLGVPFLNLDLELAVPEEFTSLLPRDNGANGKGGIIFMDGADRANPAVLRSLFQLVAIGKVWVGDYNLPTKWIIVATGNMNIPHTATRLSREEIDFAFADRFTIVNLK